MKKYYFKMRGTGFLECILAFSQEEAERLIKVKLGTWTLDSVVDMIEGDEDY